MEEAHIVVDVETPLSKISESMRCKISLSNTNDPNNFTIFRTPHNISQSKKNLFEPSVISIGPFHRGKEHLRALEEQKWRCLQDFLSRGNHISLDLCISEMMVLEKETRECYNESFIDFESNAFVEMMLLDRCFVLEYFLKLKDVEKDDRSNPIFPVAWNFDFMVLDFLLLENQIPFFIVEKLYEIGLKEKVTMNFVKYIVCYFEELANNSIDFKISDSIDYSDSPKIHHLVHLFYHYLVPNPKNPHSIRLPHQFCSRLNSTEKVLAIPCATELKEKGLKFRRKGNPSHMLDISFQNGVLEIPKLVITDATKPIFANLIAFEHSKYGKENSPFTTFVVFLDNLVNTPNDVTILQECEIVDNCLGSEEEMTKFINQVTEYNILKTDHYLVEVYTKMSIYYGSNWPRNREILIRDYFSSPWATISVIAAFILLVLTLVQSFFAVFSYVRPPKP